MVNINSLSHFLMKKSLRLYWHCGIYKTILKTKFSLPFFFLNIDYPLLLSNKTACARQTTPHIITFHQITFNSIVIILFIWWMRACKFCTREHYHILHLNIHCKETPLLRSILLPHLKISEDLSDISTQSEYRFLY